VFASDALARDFSIEGFFLVVQRMMLGSLGGRPTVRMRFLETLVSAIGQTQRREVQPGTAPLEQSKILSLAFTEGGREDLTRTLIGDYLGFLGVTFLLAGVVPTLFFF
jgi:hypothetical protein